MAGGVLGRVSSIAELSSLLDSAHLRERLDAIGTDAEQYRVLRAEIDEAKLRLSPEHSDPEIAALKGQLSDPDTDPAASAKALAALAELRARKPVEAHARLFAQIEDRLAQRFPWACGGVGRSDRARLAGNLFCDYTGKSYLSGAEPDRHGNLAGGAYDLGPDGAYEGEVVHVLQLYSGEGFDFKLPAAALQRKGFEVRRRTEPGTVQDLRDWLAGARQLWVISNANRQLEAGHIEVIRERWALGLALYIWGDNAPYFADANALLAEIVGRNFEMSGNLAGGKVVDSLASGKGFHPHPITTGLAHLFEGITVASISEAAAVQYGFTELLRGSAGNLITVVRDTKSRSGALMADGAFTRLFCNWDDAGSARYVSNAACFLAGPVARRVVAFTGEGALPGICDWTHADGRPWLVMTVAELPDPLVNTDDATLSDPLSAGARNCIVSDAAYAEAMGRWILGQPPERRVDPLNNAPIVGCLPLVDLGDPLNLSGFTEILCACFMGGKDLPLEAGLLWLAVVDRMLLRKDLRRPEVWRWLYRQALRHLRAAPDLGDLGPKLPLLEAFADLASPAADERAFARLSLESVGVIGRALLAERRAPQERVQRLARRALIFDAFRWICAPEARLERWATFERELGLGSLLSAEIRAELTAPRQGEAGSPWASLLQARRASARLAAAWA